MNQVTKITSSFIITILIVGGQSAFGFVPSSKSSCRRSNYNPKSAKGTGGFRGNNNNNNIPPSPPSKRYNSFWGGDGRGDSNPSIASLMTGLSKTDKQYEQDEEEKGGELNDSITTIGKPSNEFDQDFATIKDDEHGGSVNDDGLVVGDDDENKSPDVANKRNVRLMLVRGGSSKVKGKSTGGSGGAAAPLNTAMNYWKNAIETTISKAVQPFQTIQTKVSNAMIPQKQKDENELIEKLRTMPVQKVIVPDTKVLPPDVITIAARPIVGNPLRTSTVQDFAQTIKRWYVRNGYILHSVTGATLIPESGIAEIQVQEPACHDVPVGITFVKEMIIDNDTGELLTLRQYKEKVNARKTLGFSDTTISSNSNKIDKSTLNTTYIETVGRTQPHRIASALQLQAGSPFKWESSKWSKIVSCGIFNRIVRASPRPMDDGTVQFHIVATEAPTRHLEYGVGKSLYTGIWEGEIDFEHKNLLGGGETIGITIRRQAPSPVATTTTSATAVGSNDRSTNNATTTTHLASTSTPPIQPSVRIKYSDGRLQMDGGYDVEIFREYLGNSNSNNNINSKIFRSNSDKVVNDNRFSFFGSKKSNKNPMEPTPSVIDNDGVKVSLAEDMAVTNVGTSDNEETGSIDSNYAENRIFGYNEVQAPIEPLREQEQPEQQQRPEFIAKVGNYENDYDEDNDALLDRKGATIRINNPIDTALIRNSVASASIEQLTTIRQQNEAIGSTTWDVGPFLHELPMGARSNFDFTVTAGTRVARQRTQQALGDDESANGNGNKPQWFSFNRGGYIPSSSTKVLPYTSITATTRQIFPLLSGGGGGSMLSSPSTAAAATRSRSSRPLILAFRHSIIASTANLPRHIQQAHGTATTIRGTGDDPTGRVSSAVQGTVEIRVPVRVPSVRIERVPNTKRLLRFVRNDDNSNKDGDPAARSNAVRQDGSVVIFSDWVVSTQDWKASKSFNHKSCVGLGLRKSISGIPIQYDVCYVPKEKKLKASFGLGKDFDF